MSVEPYLTNLRPWLEQILLLAFTGALLPVVLRIRHPRTQIVYGHLVIALCLLLPLLQPWRHPVVVVSQDAEEEVSATALLPVAHETATSVATQAPVSAPSPAPVSNTRSFWRELPRERLLLWVLAAGAICRLAWLLVGLFQIRRFRIAATPLYPVPEPIQAASALTQADALFCISSDIPGPVMLGILRPVVLLPESFLGLDAEAQCGIACHELLHVRRRDWLITLLEELTGAALWFNPAIWWLLAQTRLAREQLVDAEAVRLTLAPESYIHALLTIARARPSLDLAPAPLFLRRRHLTQRMHSLLKEVAISRLQLVSGYSIAMAALTLAGWFSYVSFPLVGSPLIQHLQVSVTAGAAVLPAADVPRPIAIHSDAPVTPVASPRIATPPTDPQELAAAPIQIPSTPADRAAVLYLLERAKQNSNIHSPGTPPFQLDASFLAGGNVEFVGSGQLSETWMSGQLWRWTASLGNYSQVRIGSGQAGYDEQPVAAVPMRVHMLRGAIFWPAGIPANSPLRTAAATWSGRPVTCLLIGGALGTTAQSRLWAEEEFCMDNATGLLQMYSPAPGTYVAYSYIRGLQFHSRFFPDRVTIFVGGTQALDAQLSIRDAGSPDENLFHSTPEMLARGLGTTLAVTQRFLIQAPLPFASDSIQTVVVHAEINPAGIVLEEEVASSADARLAQPALDQVRQHRFPWSALQREAYISVGFTPPLQ